MDSALESLPFPLKSKFSVMLKCLALLPLLLLLPIFFSAYPRLSLHYPDLLTFPSLTQYWPPSLPSYNRAIPLLDDKLLICYSLPMSLLIVMKYFRKCLFVSCLSKCSACLWCPLYVPLCLPPSLMLCPPSYQCLCSLLFPICWCKYKHHRFICFIGLPINLTFTSTSNLT